MNVLTPRLQSLFQNKKSICFGRFMVEVPESIIVVWGSADVPLGVEIYPGGAQKVADLAQKFADELKVEKAIYKNNIPLLVSIENVELPRGKIVVGYDGFEATDEFEVNGYFELGEAGLIVKARPLGYIRDKTIADIRNIARRLRLRQEGDIPSEPGNCIEDAFLPDEPADNNEPRAELLNIGFRLKEFPDAHISIDIGPSNPYDPEGDSLERQFKRTFADMTSPEEKKVLENTKIFRQSPRQIHDWKTGFEVLMRSPDEEGSLSHHDFRMKFVGVPHDPYKPYADIQFHTGVGDNAAGATKATLTDEEALAVWDKITSTIRVRPTRVAGEKTAGTDSAARLPLGELAATGRTCPQTGMWAPSETGGVEGVARLHIKAGERMPHVTVQSRRSMWQKLRGERPVYQTGTLWKLVAYDVDAPTKPAVAVSVPTSALPETTNVAAKEDNGQPGPSGAAARAPSKKEG